MGGEENLKVAVTVQWHLDLGVYESINCLSPYRAILPVSQAHRLLPFPGHDDSPFRHSACHIHQRCPDNSVRHFEDCATHSLQFMELGTYDLLP